MGEAGGCDGAFILFYGSCSQNHLWGGIRTKVPRLKAIGFTHSEPTNRVDVTAANAGEVSHEDCNGDAVAQADGDETREIAHLGRGHNAAATVLVLSSWVKRWVDEYKQ